MYKIQNPILRQFFPVIYTTLLQPEKVRSKLFVHRTVFYLVILKLGFLFPNYLHATVEDQAFIGDRCLFPRSYLTSKLLSLIILLLQCKECSVTNNSSFGHPSLAS